MTSRRSLLLVALVSFPAYALDFGAPMRIADTARTAYAPYTERSIVTAGNGGSVVFGQVARPDDAKRADIVATPIDAAGTPHPENGAVIVVGASLQSVVAAAKTPSGYLMGFRDVENNGYLVPLRNDLQLAGTPLFFPGEEPWPIACDGDVCAAGLTHTVKLVDPLARSLGSIPRTIKALTALPGRGFAGVMTSSGPFGVAMMDVTLFDRAGTVTASASIPVTGGVSGSGAPAIVAHPLGAAAFWPAGSQVEGAVVRMDGAVGPKTLIPGTNWWSLWEVAAASDAGGRLAVAFTSADGGGALICTCIPNFAVWTVRLSETLAPLDSPVKVSAPYTSVHPGIAATGDGFAAVWNHAASIGPIGGRSLRIPAAGPIDAARSIPLRAAPAAQIPRLAATNGERTLTIWSTLDGSGVLSDYATLLDRYGKRLRTTALPAGSYVGSIATDGRDFMLAGTTPAEAGGSELRLFSIDGIDGAMKILPFRSGPATPRIAWDGAAYQLQTYDDDRFALTRVTPDGVVLWRRPLAGTVVIAAVAGRTIIAGSNAGRGMYDVLDAAGSVVASKTIERGFPYSIVASRRGEVLLILRDASGPFLAMRIGADGTAIDPTPVPLDLPNIYSPVAAAPIGGRWLITASNVAVEFPSLQRSELPAGELIYDATSAVESRATLFSMRDELVDGVTVKVAALRDVIDNGTAPPRRRATH